MDSRCTPVTPFLTRPQSASAETCCNIEWAGTRKHGNKCVKLARVFRSWLDSGSCSGGGLVSKKPVFTKSYINMANCELLVSNWHTCPKTSLPIYYTRAIALWSWRSDLGWMSPSDPGLWLDIFVTIIYCREDNKDRLNRRQERGKSKCGT